MLTALTIRNATVADAEFLVHGNAAMALETEHLSLDIERLREGVHAVFEEPGRGRYFVAESQGRPLGMMLITYEWSDWRNGNFWWIQSVYVQPAARGKGVFSSLYRHVDGLARGTPGVAGLRLYVETGNTRAQRTYEHAGMRRADYAIYEDDFVIHRG